MVQFLVKFLQDGLHNLLFLLGLLIDIVANIHSIQTRLQIPVKRNGEGVILSLFQRLREGEREEVVRVVDLSIWYSVRVGIAGEKDLIVGNAEVLGVQDDLGCSFLCC